MDAHQPIFDYVAERTGSALSTHQRARLDAAVREHLRGRTPGEYLLYLRSGEGAAQLAELMSVISVHKTDLFRDEVQLKAFVDHVLRPLVRSAHRPLRLWSAGCATGEEVATLLILLEEAGADPASTVLGTDIAENALEKARQLAFPAEVIRRVPDALRARYFKERAGGHSLAPELRARAQFARHNLMDHPYPKAEGGAFDVIFCRNVLIYFTDQAFDVVVASLADRLAPGGTLVLSSAEPILRRQPSLEVQSCEQAFFYRRVPPRPAAAQASTPRPAPPPLEPAQRAAALPAPPSAQAPPPAAEALSPQDEARQIFELVLDWAAAGERDEDTEQGLRRCLYLDPHFAQARYLLAMMLEQRGARADASVEYRRALAALNDGKSRASAFFLNNERLKVACQTALARVGPR